MFKKNLFKTLLILSSSLMLFSFSLQAKSIKIAFSSPNLAMPFESKLRNEAVKVAKEEGIELIILDGQGSSPKQANDLKTVILQGIDGVVLAPNDSNAIKPAVEEILKENIQIVTLDRRVTNTSKKIPHFGANNYKGGLAMAAKVKELFPQGANIILLTGQPGSSSSIERVSGIHDGLKSNNYKANILIEQTGNWFRSKAMNIIQTVLPSLTEKVDVILSANDDMALGSLAALKNLGYKKDIAIIGFDAVPEVLQDIQKGLITSTADQKPSYAVRLAIKQLVAHAKNGSKITGVSYQPLLITKDNLQDAARFKEAFPNGIK